MTADVANIRAGYDADDTVRERSAQILQQQFLISDMADIVHDALLQESVGLFQDAISIVNTLALALAAERQSLTVTQALPPTAPLALSGALTLFGSLASTVPDMELQDKLSFPGDSIFSGALEIAGRARIVGDGTFGVDDEWRGSPTMSRAEALGAAEPKSESSPAPP